MLDFEGREPIIVRDEQESFLSDDVSIMIAYNKKTGEHIKAVSMLLFTNINVLPFSEGIPAEVISYFRILRCDNCFQSANFFGSL